MLWQELFLCTFLSIVAVPTIAYTPDLPDSPISACQAPGSPSSCEESGDFKPVSCGGPPSPPHDFCTYESLCHAVEAEYLPCDCCPLPIDSSSSVESLLPVPDPVYCGENGCSYNSEDLAISAGWTIDECGPKKSLCPKSCAICPFNVEPVSCGENNCQYNNMCMALGAGFWEGDCCAIPQDFGKPCGEILKPVTCGTYGCSYDNACLARKAGYKSEECCPTVSPLAICPYIINPVTCGETKCGYNNDCEAASAGFEVENDCCPAPPENTICTFEFDPHVCDSKNCEYGNKCLAGAAGFNAKEDCSSISNVPCPFPEPSSKLKRRCKKQDPDNAKQKVTCGKEKCTFDNFCIANKLGGFLKDDCCPTFRGGCTKEKIPVKCSSDDYSKCRYRNQCRAEKVGFLESECKLVRKINKIAPRNVN